jgi:hypothetical protein
VQLQDQATKSTESEDEIRGKLVTLDIERHHLEETTIGLRSLMQSVEQSWSEKYCQLAKQGSVRTVSTEDRATCTADGGDADSAEELHTMQLHLDEAIGREMAVKEKLELVLDKLEEQQEENQVLVRKRVFTEESLQEEKEMVAKLIAQSKVDHAEAMKHVEIVETRVTQQAEVDAVVMQALRDEIGETKLERETLSSELRNQSGETTALVRKLTGERDAALAQVEVLVAEQSRLIANQSLREALATGADATIQELREQVARLVLEGGATEAEVSQLRIRSAEQAELVAALTGDRDAALSKAANLSPLVAENFRRERQINAAAATIQELREKAVRHQSERDASEAVASELRTRTAEQAALVLTLAEARGESDGQASAVAVQSAAQEATDAKRGLLAMQAQLLADKEERQLVQADVGAELQELRQTVGDVTEMVNIGADNAEGLHTHVALLQRIVLEHHSSAEESIQSMGRRIDQLETDPVVSVAAALDAKPPPHVASSAFTIAADITASQPQQSGQAEAASKVRAPRRVASVQKGKGLKQQETMRVALQQLRQELQNVADKGVSVGQKSGTRNKRGLRPRPEKLSTQASPILSMR